MAMQYLFIQSMKVKVLEIFQQIIDFSAKIINKLSLVKIAENV